MRTYRFSPKSNMGRNTFRKIYSHSIMTRYGEFDLVATEHGLYRLDFSPSQKNRRPSKNTSPYPKKVRIWFKRTEKRLNDYWDGKRVSFSVSPIDFSGYNSYQMKILRVLMKVPYGEVISYGELASLAGFTGSARAVGSVMKLNRLPIIIPCHRVIKKGNFLGEYSKGVVWKKRLLDLEGATRLRSVVSKRADLKSAEKF